jgi:hypothetical protein
MQSDCDRVQTQHHDYERKHASSGSCLRIQRLPVWRTPLQDARTPGASRLGAFGKGVKWTNLKCRERVGGLVFLVESRNIVENRESGNDREISPSVNE